MAFVIESRARSDGRHRVQRASVLVSLVFSRGKLGDGDSFSARCRKYVQDSPLDFGLPQMRFGHDPGYRATMSDDDYSLDLPLRFSSMGI
jgi:hypothetical protein